MASFTPPPSSQLQPFTVPAPQQSDPLESLAKLRQNRVQNMQVQQAQLKMQSQRALMQAFAQAGRDPDELWKVASSRGDILPDDLVTLQNHMLETQTKVANLDEKNRAKLIFDTDRYAGLMQGVTTREGVRAANARAKQMITKPQFDLIDPESLDEDTLADSLTLHVNALLGQSTMAKRLQEQATLAQTIASTASSEAGAETSRLTGKKTRKEMDKLDLAAAISAIQAAPIDEKTGTPTPAALAGIRKRFPDIPLGENPTKADIDRFIRSGVDVEKQPTYDIESGMAASGMTGKTQWDQHLFQNAKAIGKKPNELTPAEFNAIRAKYVEDNPLMQALLIQQKQLNVKQLQNTLDRTLTPEEIESFGKDFVDLNLSPDMQAVFRSRGDNAYPQILLAAKKEAAKRGIPFSPTAWETKYKTWQRTENEFATGKESDQIQSFGNLMNHAAFLYDAKNALFQNDIPVLRRIAAALGVAAGGSAETVFGTIAGFVADEATKAFLGAAGGVEERANRAAKFDVGLGNQQITDNLKALMHLADSQRIQLESKYEKGTFGKGERIGQLFSQDALNARDKVMGKAGAGGSQYKVGDTVMYQGKRAKIISIDPKTGKPTIELEK